MPDHKITYRDVPDISDPLALKRQIVIEFDLPARLANAETPNEIMSRLHEVMKDFLK